MLVDCDTTGVEPDFALVKFKKLAGGGYFKIANQSVELALTTGLRTAGIAQAAALSTSFVFRLLTFWIRIPLGWLALRSLQKRNLV